MVTATSLLGLLLSASGVAGAHYRITSPILGFCLFALGLGLTAIMLFPALVSLFNRNLETAWTAFSFGCAALLAGAFIVKLAFDSPLTDISTDMLSPPALTHPAYTLPLEEGSDLLDPSFLVDKSYDKIKSAAQATHFPEIGALHVKATADKAYPVALKVIHEQMPQWKFVKLAPEERRFELEVESPLFHFVDDVAVELRPGRDAKDTVLQVRSRSRHWGTDLGANGRRVKDLLVRFKIAIAEAEAIDAPKREAEARAQAEKLAAEKAAAEKKKADEAAALEAGKALSSVRLNPGNQDISLPPRLRQPKKDGAHEEIR